MTTIPASGQAIEGPSRWTVLALATACGVTVANIYYAQPLIGQISATLGLNIAAAGLIVTMLQIGYVIGLVFLVPLGDLVENRMLILVTLGGVIASLALSIVAPNAGLFIVASLALGVTATATQMIVPVVAHLAPDAQRGRIVGTVMSGLLIGILLARPVSALIAGLWGWKATYGASMIATLAVAALLGRVLPRRAPAPTMHYGQLLVSLWHVLRATPELQRRAAYQGLLFGAFSVFWSAVPLLVTAPPFSLGPIGLSAFLLSGVAGALIAPMAGHLADRGHGTLITGVAILAVVLSFTLVWFGGSGHLAALVAAGILLDAGTQANLVAGQRVIYALPAHIRSRLTALYLALFFLGGAIGSAISGFAVAHGGANGIAAAGLAFAAVAAVLFAFNVAVRRSA